MTIATLAGQLLIRVQVLNGHIHTASLQSSRPVMLPRILKQLMPEVAVDRIRLLYSLCANAQQVAALCACESALGLSIPPEVMAARSKLVQAETQKEQAWSLLHHWLAVPHGVRQQTSQKLTHAFLRLQQASHPYLSFGKDAEGVSDAPFNQWQYEFQKIMQVALSEPLESFVSSALDQKNTPVGGLIKQLNMHPSLVRHYVSGLPTPLSPHIPTPGSDDLLAFAQRPTFNGQCCESTPLARLYQNESGQALYKEARFRQCHPIAQRVIALLAELSTPVSERDCVVIANSGSCELEAARGRLLHQVILDRAGLVQSYSILAPTEWNFHPEGILTTALQGVAVQSKTETEALLHDWIRALDPCVDYVLTIEEEAA